MDLACSLGLFGLATLVAVAYGVRVLRFGRARFERVDRDGGSVLLQKASMEMGYWSFQPLGRALVRCGISANAVTLASLALAVAAAVAFGFGHFGLGALLAGVAAMGDALDGLVARATSSANEAGELLDASADRYAEFAMLSGLAFFYHEDVYALGLVLLALSASFMVSYSSARAAALRASVPRGAMRRTERAVLIIVGAATTPIVAWFAPSAPLGAPMLAVLALIGVGGNISAIRRLAAAARKDGDEKAKPPISLRSTTPIARPVRANGAAHPSEHDLRRPAHSAAR
jgi:phosphatidylglycerophosphate synthase